MVAIESEINHQNSQLLVLSESQQKQGLTLKQVETQCKFEFGSNKENNNLFNTKLAEVDSRLRSMEITSKAQFASSQAEIQHIQSKISESDTVQSRSKVDVPESLSSYNDKIASIVERVANLEKATPTPKKSINLDVRRAESRDIPITEKKSDISLLEDSSALESIISDSSLPSATPIKGLALDTNTQLNDDIKSPSSVEKSDSSVDSENVVSLMSTSAVLSPESSNQDKQRIILDDFEEHDIENIKATPITRMPSKELTINTSIDESTKKKIEIIKKAEESLYDDSESDWDKESISSEISSLASPQNIGLPPRARSPSINSFTSPPQKPSRDSTPPRKPSRSNSPMSKPLEVTTSVINSTTIRGPSPPRPPRVPSPSPAPELESAKNTKVEAIIPISPEHEIISEISPSSSGLSVKERLKLRMENKKQEKGKAEELTETKDIKESGPPIKPHRK
jgi:hypothetical protein